VKRLVWFALLGPPLAWALQFVLGYGVTEAACPPGKATGSVNGWTIALTVAAALVTVLAGLSAIRVYRATSDVELDGAPPEGRIYFMSIVALTITPLFLAIIVMNGVGVLALDKCHPS
jgi:hypothetical protein